MCPRKSNQILTSSTFCKFAQILQSKTQTIGERERGERNSTFQEQVIPREAEEVNLAEAALLS